MLHNHANKVVEGGGEASGAGEDLVVPEALVDCTAPGVVVLVALVVAAVQKDQVVVGGAKTEEEALVALVAPVAVVAQKDRMVVVAALAALVAAAHKDRMVAEDACGVSCSWNFWEKTLQKLKQRWVVLNGGTCL